MLNATATATLDGLANSVQAAHMMSIRTLPKEAIVQAAALVMKTPEIERAEARAFAAVSAFKHAMKRSGRVLSTDEIEDLRLQAVAEIKRLRDLVEQAKPTLRAMSLHLS
jgi:type II secretory pathway predicted ATPase ExeA